MSTVLVFIIVLAVLIFVHELGHFLAARASGIRVDAFKIGFGPRILYWKRGETEYGLNLIPFGGFVKIHGENPDEESVSGADASRSFVNKPRWKQVIVLVAGVAFNFIFAWILYSGAFMSGVTATSGGFEKYADRLENERIMITYVSPGSPAEGSGFKAGDIIKSDGSIDDVQAQIAKSDGRKIEIPVERDDVKLSLSVTPEKGVVAGTDSYAIGIAMQNVGDLQLPFITAIWEGARYTLIMIRETAVGLYTFIANIFKGAANLADVAGPVGIAGIVGNAAQMGFSYLVMITALISINLGVINLIPFPALDGGRTLFVLIEAIIRRRIHMQFANIANIVGFSLLMLLMVLVTYQDILKLFN